MKLNIDCIRDILLYLEERTTYNMAVIIRTDENNELTDKYGSEAIKYHIRQCELYDYLCSCRAYDAGDMFYIGDITPKAHEFISNTRNENNWEKVKNTLAKLGSTALDVAQNVASTVIVSQIGSLL